MPLPTPTPTPEELAEPAAPVHEPEPGPAPIVDPTPGLEPDPEPNPNPHPEDPDPEPDRDPHPSPPGGPDPDPDALPRTEPPATHEPLQASTPTESPEAPAAPQMPPPQVPGPQLILTARPVPADKPAKPAAKSAPKPKKPAEDTPDFPVSVIVGQVYDGPFDLLLDLIRKQDIDIYDIPIARITAQFLTYVSQLKAGDVDVAGEFIYTASLLIHIKSKMLLPRAPSGPDDVPEDPRRELVERLLEHERFKNAAQMLQQKQMLEAATWTNPGIREFKDDAGAEPEIAADTDDLVRIFRDILERARKRPSFNVQEDSVTVGQMMQYLGRRLTMEDKPVSLRRLLSHTKSERALVAMFLALLELVRLQAVLLRQDRAFSEIFIKKHSEFDAVIAEGLSQARDDWR
jgi:segregation and condensation protein A